MDQQTWMTLLGMAGFTLALFGYLRSIRTELKGDIAELRSEMKSDFARVDSRLSGLEQRTFDLAGRLPAPPVVQRAE